MIFNKHKQWISATLAIVMMAGFITPAFAAESNSSNVPVQLTTQAANFSVTLPTVLPVDVNAEGVVTVANDVTITNNQKGPIAISGVKVTPKNSWNLVSMDTDFTKLPAGTKSIGFSLFNKEVPSSGTVDISAVSLINGNSTIGLPYGSKLTTQNEALTEQPLDVLFTVGWYKGGNSVVDSPEALLALDKENLSMMVGAEETITATFVEKETPKGRSAFMLSNVDGVTFTSTNDEVATVDNNGLITAVGKGTAKVVATAKGLNATCNITVNALKVPLSAIDVNKTNITLNKGTTEKLVLMYNPDKFDASATVTWSSNDNNVVTVSPLNEEHDGTTGLPSYATISAINGDNATITVTVVSGGNSFSKTINVIVNEPITGLDVPSNLEVEVGETVNIVTNKLPINTTDTKPITYTTNDSSIATVNSNGVVIGISEGKTTIKVTCGLFTKTININTVVPGPEYKLATDADFSGIADGEFAYIGTDLYVEIPHVIKGVPVTSYEMMFSGTLVEGVKSTNPNITSMSYMFYSSQATTLNLKNLDTSNVTNMKSMFSSSKPTIINLSNFDTSKVTDMFAMFGYSSATSLDLSSFNTSNVTNMNQMFRGLPAPTLDLSSFDTSKVTNMGSMFNESKATTLDLNNWNTSNVTTMSQMFYNSQVTNLDLSLFDTSKVVDMNGMFYGSQATVLDVSAFNTSNVTNMGSMFNGSKATTLDLSNWDTSNVTTMSYMFYNSQVTNLDLSSFNTSKVTSMTSMFNGSRATSLNLSSFNTSNVTDMVEMFRDSYATTLDLSSFDTSKVTNINKISKMFYNSPATIGHARTQADADKFNASSSKPYTLIFVVK